MRAHGTAALFALLALGGCDDGSRPPRTRPSATPPAKSGPLRRPARTYYLEHDGSGCSVYWMSGTTRDGVRSARCPRELEAGERVRLSDSVCFREGHEAARNVPVRCPKPLHRAERDDRTAAAGAAPDGAAVAGASSGAPAGSAINAPAQ